MRNLLQLNGRKDADLLKGLAAGVIGGLAASWVMNEFQGLWSKLAEGSEKTSQQKPHGAQNMQEGSAEHGVGRALKEKGSDDGEDNATERAANAVSELVFDHKLSKDKKETGGEIVHYAMGAASGAIYGVASEFVPVSTAGLGLPFGAAVWAVADEALVPALGLSKPPTEIPIKTHAYALASHLVYGLTTELVRRAARAVM